MQRRRQENSSGLRGEQALAWGTDSAPSPPLPSLPSSTLPSPSLPLSSLPLSLRSRLPKIKLRGLGERCKLPQQGLGGSPSRQTICYLLLDQRQLILWMKMHRSNNIVLKTLSGVSYYELLAIVASTVLM